MSEQPKYTNSDEVDLGQLFLIIGRGFRNLFNFIGSVFKGIFHGFIHFLLFVQKNFVILALALGIGSVCGFIMDAFKTQKFISKMVVEPNFDSTRQLYNNIEFYNDLARAEDSITLSSALDVSVKEASTIKEVFMEPYFDDNQKTRHYNAFLRELDSAVAKTVEYDTYIKNFNPMNIRFHEISMITTNREVAKKTQIAILKSVSGNDYFELQKSTNDVNLNIQERIYRYQLAEIDSLQEFYKELMIKEAEKVSSGTNIDLSETAMTENKELALIKERDVIKAKLVELNQNRANQSYIVNIISDFPARGVKIKGFWKSYKFVLPILFLSLTIFALGILKLNRYLRKYEKNK